MRIASGPLLTFLRCRLGSLPDATEKQYLGDYDAILQGGRPEKSEGGLRYDKSAVLLGRVHCMHIYALRCAMRQAEHTWQR